MSALEDRSLEELYAERERRRLGIRLEEEAELLAQDFKKFIRAAWNEVVPVPYVSTWHVDALAEHLQAAYSREIPRLVITLPPGYLKSTIVSVLGPAWRWTHQPAERIVSASYRETLAVRDTDKTRLLIRKPWYQAHWGHLVKLSPTENMKTRYSNMAGGYRVATHVGGGTGERGEVLLLDDAHNAQEIQSDVMLASARDWWGNTWASRLNATVEDPGVKIIIGQRIAEMDVIGYILDGDPSGDRWTHLCLPVLYEPLHPSVTPKRRVLPNGKTVTGDTREVENELLAPRYMDLHALNDVQAEMTQQTIAGQYQQRPAPREGAILKRAHWRYYPREFLDAAQDGDVSQLPRFQRIVNSWDTTVKDTNAADYVAGTCWGALGGERYLLRQFHQRASLAATKTAIREMRAWSLQRWPHLPVHVLVENAANGPEVVAQLKSEVGGVVATRPSVGADKPSVKKTIRAEACEPDFEAGNVHVPGAMADTLDTYDGSRTPADVQFLIEQCATFPLGQHDDLVDSTTQALNWLRTRGVKAAIASPAQRQLPEPTRRIR